MTKVLPRFAIAILWASLGTAGVGVAFGQDYPSKPIRVITTTAGSGNDFVARLVASAIATPLGQPLIVDNRPPILAGEAAAKAPPDGYTLHINGPSVWIRPLLSKMSYDPVKDFAPISLIQREISIIAVHPSVPVRSVKELVALAKARPGALHYGSTSAGGTYHLATELFKSMAGVDIVHVPFKGSTQAVNDLLRGDVQMMIADGGQLKPHLTAGKLRALAITSSQPSTLFPDLPTVAASGVPGYSADTVTGMLAPTNTPRAIISRLNQEVLKVVNSAEVREKFLNTGTEPAGSSPEQFSAVIKAEITKFEKIIKDVGIKLD